MIIRGREGRGASLSEIEVESWTVPEPGDFVQYVGMIRDNVDQEVGIRSFRTAQARYNCGHVIEKDLVTRSSATGLRIMDALDKAASTFVDGEEGGNDGDGDGTGDVVMVVVMVVVVGWAPTLINELNAGSSGVSRNRNDLYNKPHIRERWMLDGTNEREHP
ncbi:hypothetical protein M0804_002405 [Polistes exclamans]|nr:hypothetical protein M0804_002405 [Polistes exclamans]